MIRWIPFPAFFVISCASSATLIPDSPSHPADPRAAQAPRLTESPTLSVPKLSKDETSEAGDSDAAHEHDHHHAMPDEDAEKPTATGAYSCPMHPEVTADQPGTCSKCGMSLVKTSK